MKILNNYLLIILILLSSCSKKLDRTVNGEITEVLFNVTAVENTQPPSSKNKATISSLNASSNSQIGTIPYSKNINVVYELTPINQNNNNTKNASNLKAATKISTPLKQDVLYRVLAYDSDGLLKGDKTYTYQTSASPEGMALNAEETYTFIAFSINSTTHLPTLKNENSLSTVQLENVTGDLMYNKIPNKKLSYGNNYLDLKLVHQFSSITVNLSIDLATVDDGTFQNINNARFSETSSSANMTLNSGAITYSSNKVNVENIFDVLQYRNSSEASGKPTILIGNQTTVDLTFESIQIGEEIKDQTTGKLVIDNIITTPGVKYILNIRFQTCLEDIPPVGLFNWNCTAVWPGGGGPYPIGCSLNSTYYANYVDVVQNTVSNIPNADDGFIFNIYRLDNSINMQINNQYISYNEIQFERSTNAGVQNIRFKDGDRYGYNVNQPHHLASTENSVTIDAVQNIHGTRGATLAANKPTIIIKISKHGTVQMFGTKVANGALHELELYDITTGNSSSFNTVNWHPTSNPILNEVKIGQAVDGPTRLDGDGYGRKKIPCNP